MLRIDHVMYVVRDLEESARRIRFELGLDSYPGGEHQGLGTRNRIIPLGDDQYIELITVADPDSAARHPVGRQVLDWDDGFHVWCCSTDDVEAVAERLELDLAPMSRIRPDGAEIAWRLAGVERSMRDPALPFFIQWDITADMHPSRERVDHSVEPAGIAWLEVGGDPDRIAHWTDGADLPVRVVSKDAGPRALGIATAEGEVVLR